MKKLYTIFLYCMLATASAHGMMANIFFALMALAPYVKPYVMTSEGLPNLFALSNGKDRAISFLSLCLAKIDHFGGDKCGLWKSSEKLKKEQAKADFEERVNNLTKAHAIDIEKALLVQEQELKTHYSNIIENNKKIIENLNKELQKTESEAFINAQISIERKKCEQEKNELLEKIKQLSGQIDTIKNKNIIDQQQEKIKTLEQQAKQRSFSNTLFSSVNSFTHSFDNQYTCPECNASINIDTITRKYLPLM